MEEDEALGNQGRDPLITSPSVAHEKFYIYYKPVVWAPPIVSMERHKYLQKAIHCCLSLFTGNRGLQITLLDKITKCQRDKIR